MNKGVIVNTTFFIRESLMKLFQNCIRYIRSGYSSVTGCVLAQAIRPALQNLRVFLLRPIHMYSEGA